MDELDQFLDAPSQTPAVAGTDPLDAFLDAPDAPIGTTNQPQGSVERFARGALEGVGQAGLGVFQTVANLVAPPDVFSIGGPAPGDKLNPDGTYTTGSVRKTAEVVDKRSTQAIDESRARVDELGTAGKVGQVVGQVAGSLPFTPAAKSSTATKTIFGSGAPSKVLGAATLGAASGATAPVGQNDNRGENAAIGAIAGGAFQGVASAGSAASKAIGNAANTLTKVDDIAAQELASQGIDASRATAGSNVIKSYVRDILGQSALGKGVVERAAQRAGGQIDDALDDLLRGVGKEAAEPADAGILVRESLDAARDKFKAQAAQLADDLTAKLPNNALVSANKTLALVDDLKNPLANMATQKAIRGVASEADDTLRNIVNAINEDSLAGRFNIQSAIQARKDIGSKLADLPFVDARQGALKRVYGALTDDIRAALEKESPEALDAFNGFNRFYAKNLATMKTLERKYGGQKTFEQAFQGVMSSARNGTRELDRLLNEMTPAARDNLRATMLRKMSVPKGGNDFANSSVKTFTDQWAKLTPEARKLVAGTPEKAEAFNVLARNYERVAPLVASIPENGMKLFKAQDLATGAVLTLNPSAWPLAALKWGGDAVLSRFLTNPRVVTALNVAAKAGTPKSSATALKVMAKAAPVSVRAQFAKLAAEAERTSDKPVPNSTKPGQMPKTK